MILSTPNKVLTSLQYQNAQVTGAELADSISDPLSWTQRVQFRNLAQTQTGFQASSAQTGPFLVSLAKQGPNLAQLALPAERVYVENSKAPA